MKWNETIASRCRYGDIAARIWKDWDILWEDSEADLPGHASFLAHKEGRFCFYEWWYGSCDSCDSWTADGRGDDDIEKEMRDTAIWFENEKELAIYFDRLESPAPFSHYTMTRGGGMAIGIDSLGRRFGSRIFELKKKIDLLPEK